MEHETITIVLPTYNRRDSLERCLLGLLTCETGGLSIDLRICDDGSSDGTAETVGGIRRRYQGPVRIYYHRQANQGPSAARNLGIAMAETERILCIDDDCVPDPGWIRALAEGPWEADTGALGGRIQSVENGTWVSRYCRFIRYDEFPIDDGPITFVNTANCALRRSAVRAVGGFEQVMGRAEDRDLSWRLQREGYRLRYRPEAQVRHYNRESVRHLARASWQNGRALKLCDALWESRLAPSWWRVARDSFRLAVCAARLPLLPLDGWRMRRLGVPHEDCLPFAFLRWLRAVCLRTGKLAMMCRILAGRQSLQRTSLLPGGLKPQSSTIRS